LCKGGPLCDSEGIQSFLDIFGEIDSIQNFFDIMKNRFQREFFGFNFCDCPEFT